MTKDKKDINFYKKQIAHIKELKSDYGRMLFNQKAEFGATVNKIFNMKNENSDIEKIWLKKENESLKKVIEYQKEIIDNLTRKRVIYSIPKNNDDTVYRGL